MQPPRDQPKLKTGRIYYVLLQLRDDRQIQTRIRISSEIAERFGADFNCFGDLVILTLGTLVDAGPHGDTPGQLTQELSRRFGDKAKILHGSEIGHSGFMVGNHGVRYNVLLPCLTQARHRIRSLDWGELVELAN